jgi:hypothetical protein
LFALSIVKFRPNQLQTAAGNPVRLTLFRSDRAPALQFSKQEHVEARGTPTFSIDTDDAFDFAAVATFHFNAPALREQVKDALFSA